MQAAQAAISEELSEVGEKLQAARRDEATAVSAAARSGRTPKASQTVAKLRQRQDELEGRTLAQFAQNFDLPAVSFNDLLDDCQAQSAPRSSLGAGFELLEDFFQAVFRYAFAGVAHPATDAFVIV